MEKLFPMVKAELQKSGLWRDEYERERRAWFERTVGLIRERARTLTDFPKHGRPYFVDNLDFEFNEAAVKKNLQKDPALKELLPQSATLSRPSTSSHTIRPRPCCGDSPRKKA